MSTAFESPANAVHVSNHTDGNREQASAGSTSRAVELWDDSYVQADSMVYYGQLDVSGINSPYHFDGLQYLIIDDKTDAEIDKLFFNNITIGGVYGYISVGDFDPSNTTWFVGKQTAVDNWLDLNQSMSIFFDGLDSGTLNDTDGTFSAWMKNLTDYVKVDKEREVGINVFTNFQEFAQLSSTSGFAMKESCIQKWQYNNNVDDTAGYNYTGQFWEDSGGFGDYNKSRWYLNHNVNVVCVAFADRNYTAYLPDSMNDSNYSLMEQMYFKSRVLGYEHFIVATPHFSIAYYDKYYDTGTSLQDEPSIDGDVYSMKYTKGIVYFNASSNVSWFEDGRAFTNGSLSLKLHDNTVFNYDIEINDELVYGVTTAGAGFAYNWYTVYFNESVWNSSFGHYMVNISSGDGGFIGADTSNLSSSGKRSYFDSSGEWSAEADTTGNHMIALIVNDTKSVSLATTRQIMQAEANNSQNITIVNITSVYDFDTNVWSAVVQSNGTFGRIMIWNGSEYVDGIGYTDSSACTGDNPTFTTNTITGVGDVGVCIDNSSSNVKARVNFPSLSERAFEFNTDNVGPTITTIFSPENRSYNTSTIYFNATADENVSVWFLNYNISENNQTLTNINTTLEVEDGSHQLFFYANDSGWNNTGLNNTVYFVVDTVFPLISYGGLIENDGVNISASAIFANVSVTESGGMDMINFTLYNDTGLVNTTEYRGSDGNRSVNWTGLPDTNYTYNVTINDSAGNFNSTASRFIRLDNVAPGVDLLNPGDEVSYISNSQKVTFQYNVTESGSGVEHCNLTVGSSVVNTTLSGLSLGDGYSVNLSGDGVNEFLNNFAPEASRTWNVSCYDYASNSNTSAERSFTVTAPVVASTSTATGGGVGGGAGTSSSSVRPTVIVDPDGLSASLFAFTSDTEELRITNLRSQTMWIAISVEGEIVDVLSMEKSFVIGAGETKVLKVKIDIKDQGLLTGEIVLKADGFLKIIPVFIDVRSEDFLFDVANTISDEYKFIDRGEKLKVQFNLLQVGPREKVDVTANYVIKDFRGKVYFEESETFFVLGAKDFIKEFDTRRLPPGKYIAGVEIVYPGAFATASSQFEIESAGLAGIISRLVGSTGIVISVIVAVAVIAGLIVWKLVRGKGRRRIRKKRK